MTTKKGFHYAWVILIGLILMMGFARGGMNNALSLFLFPVSQEFGYGIGSLSIMFSISSIIGIIWMPIAGKLLAKYDIRIVGLFAIVIHAGAFACLGFAGKLWGFYSLAAIMTLGSSFTTTLLGPVLINSWFKEKNGMAMGIMMAAVGLFGAILQPVTANVITNYGWRNGYFFLGILCLIVIVPVMLFIFKASPLQKGLRAYGEEEGAAPVAGQAAAPQVIPGITSARALKSPSFYALFLFMFFLTGIGAFGSHVPTVAVEAGFDTAFGGVGMSFWMIGTLLGALLFGGLTDKIGAKKASLLGMCFGIVAVLLLIFFRTNPTMFKLALFIYGFLASTIGTMAPLLVSSVFGGKDFAKIFAYITMAIYVASTVLIPVYGFVYDIFGSYQYVLYMILIFLLINIACIIVAFNGAKKLREEF